MRAGLILGLALFCATASAQQQIATTAETAKSASLAIAEKALQWMPESFRRVLSRNMDSLRNGINEVHAAKFLMASDRLTLEEDLLQRMATTVSRLQSRPKFSEAAIDFGALAQMMFLLNLPENEAGSSEKLFALSDVIGRNTQAFRVVVYDASEIGGSRDEVSAFLETVRQRRKRLSERFSIEATRLPAATIPLDPRSATVRNCGAGLFACDQRHGQSMVVDLEVRKRRHVGPAVTAGSTVNLEGLTGL